MWSANRNMPGKILGTSTLHDVKIVVGNKAIMAEEGIAISKTVDEYMRDMEVRLVSDNSWSPR